MTLDQRPALPTVAGVQHRHLDLSTGVRAHVAVAGPPDAPRVLALHGWPQHWWAWRHVIDRLDGRVRIACPDLRGLGWSGWPTDGDFRKARLAEDAVATLDALGWDDAVVVGHDWGGIAAYLTAVLAPTRVSALLVASVPHPWQPPGRMLRSAHRFAYQVPIALPGAGAALIRRGRYVSALLDGGSGPGFRLTPTERSTYVDVLRDTSAARASERYYRSFLLRDAPQMRGAVAGRRLLMPARSLFGTADPLGTDLARGLEDHGDDAHLDTVDGAGHWLPEQHPQLVADRILHLTLAVR